MTKLEELSKAYKEAVTEFNDSDNSNEAYLEGYMLGLKNAIAIMED